MNEARMTVFRMVLCAGVLCGCGGVQGAAKRAQPRLVLEIVVDQLRGDMPAIVLDRCGPGGFRYLAEKGLWYENAHHPHANTETIVGHVTLATGAYPSRHGMVANVWFDAEKGRLVYHIEDPDYKATGGIAPRDMDSEADYTRGDGSAGRSPRAIMTTTFSDELQLFYGPSSKIFAASGKDRGAVSMAGHVGKAFWYSTQNGRFASSTYYYEEFPKWVSVWNAEKKADAYFGEKWRLSDELSNYRYGQQDNRKYENPSGLGYGKVFPHSFGDKDSESYYTLLMASPVVDELTVDFAKELIKGEEMGKDDVPDYLAVSLSSTDYVGHLFGPASLESEENLLRLDRTLADLFRFVDKTVGLKKTLIVLSADHGTPEAPEYLSAQGLMTGRLNPDSLDYTGLDAELERRFGLGHKVIKTTFHPYMYLDRELIRARKLDLDEVSRVVAQELIKIDGIAYAFSRSDLAAGRVPDACLVARQVLHNFNPKRCGDIYIVYEPHWTATYNKDIAVVNHGSPWEYDTYVPIIFAGADIRPQRIHRPVETVDIAPTLSLYLGIKPPSGSVGHPLAEVLSENK